MLSKKYLKTPFYFKVLECSKVDRVIEKTLSQMQVSRIQKFSPTNHGRLRLVEQEREVLKCVTTNIKLKCFNTKFMNKGIPRPVKVKRFMDKTRLTMWIWKVWSWNTKGRVNDIYFFAGYIFKVRLACPTWKKEKYLCKKRVRSDL